MKIQCLPAAEALQSLRSSPDGLTAAEAHRRLAEFGPNQVEPVRGPPLASRFLSGFTHFLAVILWVATGLAFVAAWYDPGAGMATLGCAILAVIVLNGLFSFWQEFRAEKALAALRRLLPHQVTALRDGLPVHLPAEHLVPGDVILLEDGNHVPADCRLLQAFGVRVNNATVTGEALPQARDERPTTEEGLLHSRNILLAGTCLVSGQARALVFATGMHTEFGKIARLTQTTEELLSPLQKEIVVLSRTIALLALVLGVVFFLIGRVVGVTFWENFLFAIGIIVANVPEGLLPTVSLALALSSQRMARRNALVRHLPAVEALGCATVICTDKTGTLTQNRMAVKRLYVPDQFQDPSTLGQAVLTEAQCLLLEGALLCHTLKATTADGRRTWWGDPMEVALVEMAAPVLPAVVDAPRIDEVPFDTDRKRLSTLHQTPQGLMLYTKGALETVLPLCRQVWVAGQLCPLTEPVRAQVTRAEETMAEAGLRVLAFAVRRVPGPCDREDLENELVLTGLVGLEDPVRPEVPEAIRRCKEAGIKVIMVTGDHPRTARAVGRQIGLVETAEAVLVTGEQLRHWSDSQLRIALDAPEILFARVGADQKLRIVQALKAKKQIVAVTGDGVNDAPALRQADIGIAMGRTGTDVAQEAADLILLDDNFASIVAAVEEGRAVYENMKKFLTYILTHNVAELIPYLAFVLFRIPLALTVLQILAIDLGTDTLPALALGAEPPDPGTMRRPPRSRQERLLSRSLLLRTYLFLGLLEAAAALAAFFHVLGRGGWRYGQALRPTDPLYLRATTACLAAIVVMQVVNIFLCRSDTESLRVRGVRGNPLILLGIAAEVLVILLLVYTPVGNLLFGTAPLPGEVWLFVLPFALGLLVLEELRKGLLPRARSASKGCPAG